MRVKEAPGILHPVNRNTVYPKKYAHGYCFAVLCCGYTLTDFPISIRLTSLALWQSNDCPSASKANLMNMDKYFMWIHYERLHNHNKAKHNKTVCICLGIYCTCKTPTTRCDTEIMCNFVYINRYYSKVWTTPPVYKRTLGSHYSTDLCKNRPNINLDYKKKFM